MIVPRSKLLNWVALLLLPFATIAAIVPAAAPLAIAIMALFLALALADALFSLSDLNAIGIRTLPVTRLSKDREGALEIQIENRQKKGKRLRLGLALPMEFRSSQEEILTDLPADILLSKISWKCTPLKRGSYNLDKCFLETSSPLGFWATRDTKPIAAEIRAYPNLLTERKNVAALFLNRGNFGAHAQRQVGKGRDFEKLRDYVPGDSYDEIHWKATAKRGKPVTKIFQIERTQEVYVIIDSSRLTARTFEIKNGKGENSSVSTVSVLERFITSALILGLAAEQQGDLFGLLAFSDSVKKFVRAKNGKAHFSACREALYTLHPQSVTPDFDELCTFIRLRLRRRALLIFLTSLDDPLLAESFTRNMDLISRQHLVLVNMIQPSGAQPLFSAPNLNSSDEVYQHLGGHLLWNNLRELEKTLQRRGVGFSLVNKEKLTAQIISEYLSVKQRQLL